MNDTNAEILAHDDDRIAAELAALDDLPPAAVALNRLGGVIATIERGTWLDPQSFSPVREVKLTPAQKAAYRRVAARAVATLPGSEWHAGKTVWRSDGTRIWEALPW